MKPGTRRSFLYVSNALSAKENKKRKEWKLEYEVFTRTFQIEVSTIQTNKLY